MPLHLTEKDEQMLHSDHDPATRMATRILVRMAEVSHAQRLLDICAAHIDSSIYIGEAGLEFAERLASLGAQVSVPTTLNVSGIDEHHWNEWAVPSGRAPHPVPLLPPGRIFSSPWRPWWRMNFIPVPCRWSQSWKQTLPA